MFTVLKDSIVFAATSAGTTTASLRPVYWLIGCSPKRRLGPFDYRGIREDGEDMVKGRSLLSRWKTGGSSWSLGCLINIRDQEVCRG